MIAALIASLGTPAPAADRRYTVTDFDRVQVEGPFTIVLKTGKPPSARATGSAQATDRVSIEVQSRTLKVRPNRSAWSSNPGKDYGPLAIEITTHDLRAASVNGSGSLAIDKAKAMRFDLTLSGSGRISVADIRADNLIIGMLGAGKMSVGGKVKEFRGTVQGTGDFDGSALAAEDVRINSDTSGTVTINARRTADIVSGATGDTIVLGKPACTVKALGSGRVSCGAAK